MGWCREDARLGWLVGFCPSFFWCSLVCSFSLVLDRVFAAGACGETGTWMRFLLFLITSGNAGVCTLGAEWGIVCDGGVTAGMSDAVMDLVVRLPSSCGG